MYRYMYVLYMYLYIQVHVPVYIYISTCTCTHISNNRKLSKHNYFVRSVSHYQVSVALSVSQLN